MRIRTGKPIVLASLLGQQNISKSFTYANINFYPSKTGSFITSGESSIKTATKTTAHKYFLFLNANIPTYSWSYFGLWDAYQSGYTDRLAPTVLGNNYYALITATSTVASSFPTFQFGGTSSTEATTAYYMIIIDLTASFGAGKEPTAEQFYNNYKQYFEQLANGESVVTDGKIGKINCNKDYPILPEEYQEVEYIESSGTQYIDTNIILDNNDDIELQFVLTSSSVTSTLWCARAELTQNTRTAFYIANSGIRCDYNSTQQLIANININEKHIFSSVKNKVYLDDTLMYTFDDSVFSTTLPLKLFASYNGSDIHQGIDNFSRIKLYGLKIVEKALFIPCYRKYDRIPGLYDLVNNIFYTNAGTGEFILGNNVYHRLPSEYQQLQYLRFNKEAGPQWFEITDFKFSNNFEFDTEIKLNSKYDYNSLWCSSYDANRDEAWLYGSGSFSQRLNFVQQYYDVSQTLSDKITYKCKLKDGIQTISINNNKQTVSNPIIEFNDAYLGIGAFKGNTASDCNIYSWKIYKKEHLAFNLIPCYHKEDNIIGLYDTVNFKFYTNQGSGSLLSGPEVYHSSNMIVRGGQSDKYYGYNQLSGPMTIDYWYNEYNQGPVNARTYDSTNNSSTYTVGNNNRNFRALSTGTHTVNITANHKYLFIGYFDWNLQSASISSLSSISVLTSPYINLAWSVPISKKAYSYVFCLTPTASGNSRWVFSPAISGTVADGDTFTMKDVMLIDLTDWFGAGNEPTTIQEFKAKFNKDYYPYQATPIKLTQIQINNL